MVECLHGMRNFKLAIDGGQQNTTPNLGVDVYKLIV
jgi:hypothetical protein